MTRSVSRMTRWGRDTQLQVRMFIVMFLLAALYLGFMAVLWAAGVQFFSILTIAVVLLLVQYFMSDKIAMWSMGAHEVSAQEAPELHAMVQRLAQSADLPMPRIAMSDSRMPNAFATGRGPKSAVVAVTEGLMNRLDGPEVEAVLAHELSHVRNHDVAVMTIASFFAMAAQLIMRWFFWGAMFGGMGGGGGRRGRDNGAGAIALVYLASLVVWVISFFLIRTLSRYREYAADRGSAIITGAPSHLMSALIKISGVMDRIPDQDLREVQGMNALFIFPAVHSEALSELFSTHPSLEHRLERLRALSREMEGL
ncbi:MAG TPA: zinc metalloprotease HtpX [Thermomicrobiaceae bacterium]|nr:zinc metalloprotease HtpX [Thermomicrobiaceae bacterium]